MTAHTPPRADHAVPPVRRRSGAVFGLFVGMVLAGVIGAPSAFAHTELESSDPADGGTVGQVPTSIQLVFADTVRGADPVFTITVAGADPIEVPAVIDGATVTADLDGVTLPAVAYPASWQVGYRLVASDGDAFRGDITFTVTAGPATTASPEPTTPVSTAPVTTAPVTTAPATTAPATTAPATIETSTAGTEVSAASASSASTVSTVETTTTATSTATPAATFAAAPDDRGGSGLWWPVGIAVVVLIAGGGFWYVRGRRAAPPAE